VGFPENLLCKYSISVKHFTLKIQLQNQELNITSFIVFVYINSVNLTTFAITIQTTPPTKPPSSYAFATATTTLQIAAAELQRCATNC
jgi:hypothetical protein